MTSTFIFVVYAILLCVGGFIGYKAGSKVSLIMGTLSAAVVGIGAYLANQNSVVGFWLVAIMSLVLVVTFSKRFVATKKFMPSGMLVIVSLLVLALALKHLI